MTATLAGHLADQAAPPTANEQAEAVLGSILLTGQAALDICSAETGLRAAHFYHDAHRHIYTACVQLADRGDGIDHLTVLTQLRADGLLAADRSRPGLQVLVRTLAASPPVVGNVAAYARAVIDAHRWRSRTSQHQQALQAAAKQDEQAYNAATAVTAEPDRGQQYDAAMLAAAFEHELNQPTSRIPLPWQPLTDGFNGGVMPGDTTVLAAHSSHGKSTVAGQWLHDVAMLGGRTAIYTNETTIPDMRDRLLAGMTDLDFSRLQSKSLTDVEFHQVRQALKHFRVILVPVFGWGWQDIARHMRRSRWDLCCLDLFQRLPARDRISDVDAAIHGLCDAAAMADTHLVVCAQLNQASSKSNIRPVPSGRDLRESGEMYNAPANVVFVHQEQDEDPVSGVVTRTGEGQVWIDKARNGRPGARVRLWLNPSRMRFESEVEWRQRPGRLEAVA